jgi:hypothetical protein
MVVLLHDCPEGWTDCRNWPVAWKLYRNGFAVLLVNPLKPEEQSLQYAKGFPQFELPLLVERLRAVIRWTQATAGVERMATGVVASRMAAAAAIQVAAGGAAIDALVCKAAPTDLVADVAPRLTAPILLVADESDHRSRRRNCEFSRILACEKKVVTLKGCRHRSDAAMSALRTAQLAVDWFDLHLQTEQPEYLAVS